VYAARGGDPPGPPAEPARGADPPPPALAPESPMTQVLGRREPNSAPQALRSDSFRPQAGRPCAGSSRHAEEWGTVSPTTTRHAEPDQACAEAVDLARQAAVDDAGAGQVGDHVGMEVEGDRVLTHLFECLDPAYVGWRWAVTVARASRSKVVTVSESLLLPGPDSLLAPDWVPWTDRVRPGDLKAGDLMPASSDDERLVPLVVLSRTAGLLDWQSDDTWNPGAELAAAELADESPLDADEVGEIRRSEAAARPRRVLSAIGRDEAAIRWHLGEHGPKSPLASAAPACCITCGFMVRLDGPLGRVFGVCANEYAPDDGSVVSVDHGCGAHSDGDVVSRDDSEPIPTIDELGYDMLNAASSVPDSVLENLENELL
jgi:hypothetical protein